MRTVCEIGFNAGHSTLTWLEANPNLVVYTFDINHWKYTEVMVNYLKAKYPGRLNSCFGDSTVTLPLVSANTDIKCDVAVVDGGLCIDDHWRNDYDLRDHLDPHPESSLAICSQPKHPPVWVR